MVASLLTVLTAAVFLAQGPGQKNAQVPPDQQDLINAKEKARKEAGAPAKSPSDGQFARDNQPVRLFTGKVQMTKAELLALVDADEAAEQAYLAWLEREGHANVAQKRRDEFEAERRRIRALPDDPVQLEIPGVEVGHRSIVSAANAAPVAGVLHVLATKVTTVGSDAGSSTFEAWLDDESRRYRVTWRDANGALFEDMAVQDNQKLIYIPGLNHLDRRSYDRSDTIGLQGARLSIWRYKELIKLGIAKSLGNAEIDGKLAPKVFVPAQPGDDQEVEAILDAGTLAPLVETIYRRTSTGGREVGRSIKTTYTTWEVIPTTNVSPKVFELVSPGSATVTSYTNLSSESAAKITGRAIYYVGPTFRQLPIYSLEIVQTTVKSPMSPPVDRV